MAPVVVMPQLGNSVESCLIVSWQVAVGDEIAENGVICEVETDKASMEVPTTAGGTVLALLWEEGDDVPVKEPLIVVGAPGEDPAPALADAGWKSERTNDDPTPQAPPTPAGKSANGPFSSIDTGKSANGRFSGNGPGGDEGAGAGVSPQTRAVAGVSPRARTLAGANALDLGTVEEGTGPHGRIIERDVRAALTETTRGASRAGLQGGGGGLGGRTSVNDDPFLADAPDEDLSDWTIQTRTYPGETTSTPLKGIRKTIADRMMHSLASSAQLTYTTTANAAGLLALRKRLKSSDPELGYSGVTIGDLVGYAAVRTAAKHHSHNAHLSDGVLTTFEQVHLGFACDTPRGLLVPTVRHASQMGLREFSVASKELAQQAIGGSINPDLLSGATFTVSNLGSFGIESFTPLLNVPQVAILGVDAIFPRAVVNADGGVGVEQRIGFSLTADHRVIDGADAARFLADLVKFVENIDITVLG